MTEWEPATESEAAMRDALRTGDQELYFRILARTELLLPVSAEAMAGRAPTGWGTWTTSGRTHVLAFTSVPALRACLAEHAGAGRSVAYHELAATWPNLEWWLAVNPGLPIEGYLPAWFVAQLARGDVRLPGRATSGRVRLDGTDPVSRARATATVPGQSAPQPAAPRPREAAPPVPTPARMSAGVDGSAPVATPAPPAPVPAVPGPVAAMPAPSTATPAPNPAAPAPTAQVSAAPVSAAPVAAPAPVEPPAPPVARPTTGEAPHPPPVPGPGPATVVHNPASGNPLPRRPVRSPSERPGSMAAAARALAGTRQTVPLPASAGPAPVASPARPATAPQTPPPPDTATSVSALTAGVSSPTARVTSPTAGPGPAMPAQHPPRRVADGARDTRPAAPPPDDFTPATDVEHDLLSAAESGSTDAFLSTLLLARVLLPVSADAVPGSHPGDDGFAWRTETLEGERYVVVFTSPERMADHLPEPVETASVRFVQLIRRWPDPSWSFAVNPGTPVGATLPGAQIVALASWAAEVGLGDDDMVEPARPEAAPAARAVPRSSYAPTRHDPNRPTMMQKAVAPSQVDYYLKRSYDRVSGFVHRVTEVEHLRTPAALFSALGLGYAGSPFHRDADEIFVLRWPAHRPSLYRIPYGGQSEHAMRAMEGWVIERAPFRGNGFAPGESSDVIAEFKVDSARLPHGAQLWRIRADGSEEQVAVFDYDIPAWRQVGDDA